jgi:hexosaminidase
VTATGNRWASNLLALHLQIYGAVKIPTTGIYTFYITSDDGSRVRIDGQLLASTGGVHGPLTISSGPVSLTAGWHPIS